MNQLMKHTQKVMLSATLLMTLIFTSSCGDGSSGRNIQIPGVQGPTVTLFEDNVLIAFVFENVHLQGGLRFAVPKYPSSYIEISPDLLSGGTLMSVSISLDDVFGGDARALDPQTLPGGRALPGVASGRLPAIAFSIEKFHNMAFYLGPDVFGIFVPVKKLGIGQSIATFRFFVGERRSGNISLVGEDENGEHSGILLMLDMKANTKKQLEKLSNRF